MEAMVEGSLGASFHGGSSWRLRPSFICGCCSCLEEGALEEEGYSREVLQWSDCFEDSFSGEVAHNILVCVQGFLHQSFREQGRFISVDWTTCEEGAPC
jgi:hypothetical protein